MEDNTGLIQTSKEPFNGVLTFYRENEETFPQWFIDLPEYLEAGGTKAELEMVLGADTLLDILSKKEDKVKLQVSELPFTGCSQLELVSVEDIAEEEEIGSGAYYYIDTIGQRVFNDRIWLCDVTKYVLGGFPETIYFKVV